MTTTRQEKKEPKPKQIGCVRTTEVELTLGEWLVSFLALDEEGRPLPGQVIEVFDYLLPNGSTRLAPTNESGQTSYRVKFGTAEHRFVYVSGNITQTKRLWR